MARLEAEARGESNALDIAEIGPGSGKAPALIKRVFDIAAASTGLLLTLPLFVIAGLLIKRDSPGPVFFRQERMGKGFKPFRIYKFRTMVQDAPRRGMPLTVEKDPRITRIGSFLRKTKIDELPQLINVLKGDMSLVGPRPEMPCYVELFRKEYEEILRVRPGVTDLASLKYRNEEAFLRQFGRVEEGYVSHVLPDKIKLAKENIRRSSLRFDMMIIFLTVCALFKDRSGAREKGGSAAHG